MPQDSGKGPLQHATTKMGLSRIDPRAQPKAAGAEGVSKTEGGKTEAGNPKTRAALEFIDDDWLRSRFAHRSLGRRWLGRTQFEFDNGEWVTQHHNEWRITLITQMRARALTLPDGRDWTDRRLQSGAWRQTVT